MRRGLLPGLVGVGLFLAASGVVASALNDLPQDARPIQDVTGDLNRQPQVQPPQPAPSEPAPEGLPAPAAPVAITPPASALAIETGNLSQDTDAPEGPVETVQAKVEPQLATPAVPLRRQRHRVAIVEAVDKVTAERMRFEVPVGGRPIRFQKTLIFTARACERSTAEELVADSVAYLEVSVQPRGVLNMADPRQIFRGWMFASSPAVSGLEHPVYDAWIVGCKA